MARTRKNTRKTAPLLGLTTLAALGLAAAPHAARAQTIDPFTSGAFAYAVGQGGSAGGDQSAANVVGGDRTVTVYNPYNATPFTAALPAGGAGATVGPGYALFGLGYGYRYNGGASMAGNPSTELHLDLTHADRLRFTFSAVSGTVQIYATLQNLNGGTLSNGNPGDPVFTVSAPGTSDLLFSNLRGSVNLADVNFISLSLQPYGGSSFTLTGLSAAPEPSPWAGLGAGALGLSFLALRARRRASAPSDTDRQGA